MTDKEMLHLLTEQVIEGSLTCDRLQSLELPVLLKLAGRIKKYRGDHPGEGIKIAVLGSYSIQYPVSVLDVFLKANGIDARFYEGEYDGIRMDVLDDGSQLYAFAPQIVLLMMDHRDIHSFPDYFDDESALEALADRQMAYFQNLWEHLSRIEGCQVLQTNIALPFHRSLGNLEGNYGFSASEYYRRINRKMALLRPGFVTIIDMEYMSSLAGKKAWFDFPSYFLTKTGFSLEYLGMVCGCITSQILAMTGHVRKCLVLDLDNTLWGGVVGDDGYDGIQLDPHNAVGEAYRYFQKYVLALKQRGVILAVCSKNEADLAREPFEKNENMILKLSDISCFVANWEDKAGNLRTIAAKLNIGVDSLVFVDDNPAEREIVRTFLPQVLVPELPEDPAEYASCLEESNAFAWTELTREDLRRNESYAANREREAMMESFVDYDAYLNALEMKAKVGCPGASEMERFVQLINKSNQFNLRTRRYTRAQADVMAADEDTKLFAVELSDKFSRYGLINCIILKKLGEVCFVDTWLMSCRVLKRGIETLAMNQVVKLAGEWGCTVLAGEYIPTAKNRMVENFYPNFGFDRVEVFDGFEKTEPESVLYRLNLSDYKPGETRIQIEEE